MHTVCAGHTSPAHSEMHAHKKVHSACPPPPRVCSARAVSSSHQHHLQRCPHESFACRHIQETEVTCSHKAAQTQINKLAVTLAFTQTNSLSLASSCFFLFIFPVHLCIIRECVKSPLLAVKLESVVSFLSNIDAEGCWIYSSLLGFGGIFTAVTLI